MATTPPPLLVTGGTGTLGSHLVPLLAATGQDIRVLSRHEPADRPQRDVEHVAVDLSDPSGVPTAARAATDVGTVVHLAGSSKGDDIKTRHLIEAIVMSGGRPHVVYISVVGVDRTPVVSAADRAMFGYVAAKAESEKLIAGSGLPWTTLRATQFHDLVLATMRTLARMPVMVVPSGTCMQPVDPAEVAARLVELALGPPHGLVPDFAGPQVHTMEDLARSYLRATGKHRPVLPLRMPGRAAQAFRNGANLSPGHAVGLRTWGEFLVAHAVPREDAVPRAS